MSAEEKEATPAPEESGRAGSQGGTEPVRIEGSPETARATSTEPDYSESISFLRRRSPQGPWVLTAIIPDPPKSGRKTFTRTFAADDEAGVRAWLEEHGSRGRRNLYFTVNQVLRPVSEKPSREDIASLDWLHVDIDPRPGEDVAAEQARALKLLQEYQPPPTVIVFSGGGYQGFWRLRVPMRIEGLKAAYDEAALYNQHVELELGGDKCHSVDHVMRLPGTVNRPDARKRKKGRVEALAGLREWHEDRVYDLAQFPKAAAVPTPGATVQVSDNVQRLASVDDLPAGVSQACKVVIVQGTDPDNPTKFGGSRSEWVWHVCCELVRAGCSDELIYAVITDPDFLISASVLEKGSSSKRYALRQIERAREEEADFTRTEEGRVLPTLRNTRMAMTKLGVTLEFDEFAERALISGLEGFGPFLDDAAVTRLWLAIEETFQLTVGRDRFWAIAQDVAFASRRHPVREYLDTLTWDGTRRLDLWLSTYLGVPESDYTRAVGVLCLVAAVRRVRSPGCKFDEMVVLEGPQGGGKSSALAALAGNAEWFTDDLPLNASAQRFIEATIGKWIVEAGELKGMRKSDIDTLKSCLSRPRDRARMAYGRLSADRPRQFVIFGTTNSSKYLKDPTGGRRFWPVTVGRVQLAELRRDRDMLWAEAALRESAGESVRLDQQLYDAAGIEQERRRVEDPFVQRLGDMLGDLQGKIHSEDVWAILGVASGHRTQDHNARLGEAMRELGWESKRLRIEGKPSWCYARGEGPRLAPVVDEVGRVLRVEERTPDPF